MVFWGSQGVAVAGAAKEAKEAHVEVSQKMMMLQEEDMVRNRRHKRRLLRRLSVEDLKLLCKQWAHHRLWGWGKTDSGLLS